MKFCTDSKPTSAPEVARVERNNMKLKSYISVISTDEIVHIISGNKTMFFGRIGDAYSYLPDEYLNSADVIYVHSGFGGLCIEAVV